MNKIYIPVGGRLGNQLFYYGFGRWLQSKYLPKHVLCFDFSAVYKQGGYYKYDKNGWQNSLEIFRAKQHEVYDKDFAVYREGDFLQKIWAAVIKKIKNNKNLNDSEIEYFSKIGLIYNCRPGLEKNYLLSGIHDKDVFVRSVLESDYYINQIRDELLGEITSCHGRKKENKELYKIIDGSESVCISVRRGDYVSNPELNYTFNICDKNYFDKAIKEIKERIDNPVLIFFSDDITWCKENFGKKIELPVYFESGNDDLAEKISLMSACKHFIISNSTFSWWAQWLATNENKIVVSPSKWYRDADSYLVLDSFIKIEVE